MRGRVRVCMCKIALFCKLHKNEKEKGVAALPLCTHPEALSSAPALRALLKEKEEARGVRGGERERGCDMSAQCL
jgi:hypothetical protein